MILRLHLFCLSDKDNIYSNHSDFYLILNFCLPFLGASISDEPMKGGWNTRILEGILRICQEAIFNNLPYKFSLATTTGFSHYDSPFDRKCRKKERKGCLTHSNMKFKHFIFLRIARIHPPFRG